ncbi:MAG: 3-dehydroquinate synthase [Bacteroidetes bacterium]|nr:3-dehydroquinate synthase [Bacteroidota bacterium]
MSSGAVVFSQNFKEFPSLLPKLSYSQTCVLVDSNTRIHCYPALRDFLPPHELIEVPAGEEQKNITTCQLIWQKLTDKHFDRHSLVIVLGGGVLGDMGGFCAATYKRGIDFVLVPTTLLAQVDASVGGKLGIDFNDFKNQIGVFCEPQSTVINTHFLKTLPLRELRSGFAEVVKHCLISDAAMWETIRKKSLDEQNWEVLVKHSVDFKKSVTETDPREKGLRKILNFGHTIGHALESYFLTQENRIFHGEAIAMGMIMESFIATEKKLISEPELHEIVNYLIKIFGKESSPWKDATVISLMTQDKKNRGAEILAALPEGIGKAKWDVSITEKEIVKSFDFYRSL